MNERVVRPDQEPESLVRRPWETPELHEIPLSDGTEAHKGITQPTETLVVAIRGPAS